jgi:surface polysaccharide O-acyltransferase-like enzyme
MPESAPVMERYHGIDCFRAVAMLLGIVIHSTIFYFVIPDPGRQVYLDNSKSLILEVSFYFFHTYRMPCFFLVAGFFAAFLHDTRGIKAFFVHRWKRIGVPLIVGTVVLFPLMGVVTYNTQLFTTGPKITETSAQAIFDSLFMHLWFLYHLILFSLAAMGLLQMVSRLPEKFREAVLDVFERFALSPAMLIGLSIPTGYFLFHMEYWTLDQSSSPLPPLRVLGMYALCYAFGWFLFKRVNLLQGFQTGAWRKLSAALVLFGLYYYFRTRGFGSDDPGLDHELAIACLAPATWLGIYAFLGLFLRYFNALSPIWRYISDGAYWMYIIHLPIAIALAPVLSGVEMIAELKFAFVFGATTALCLITYHFLVRATFVGAWLNGRKYPRVAPWRKAVVG